MLVFPHAVFDLSLAMLLFRSQCWFSTREFDFPLAMVVLPRAISDFPFKMSLFPLAMLVFQSRVRLSARHGGFTARDFRLSARNIGFSAREFRLSARDYHFSACLVQCRRQSPGIPTLV